jgi:hypothetical protein
MAVIAPSNCQATPISPTKITVTWTNGQTYDSIYLYRKVTGGSWSKIATLGGGVTGVGNVGLVGGTQYNYRVQGNVGEESSDYSNTATATTPLETPSGCEASCIDSDSAYIEWDDKSQTESGFKIYKDGSYMVTVGANVEGYQKNGLTPGHTYKFKVKAYNGYVDSAFSNEASVTLVEPPAKPTNLTDQAQSSSTIRLNWQDNSNNETGFKIYESTNGVDYSQIDTVGPNVITYLRTGRSSNTQYWHKVRSYNGNGNSQYSNSANAVTFAAIAAPTNLVATPFSDTKNEITFQDNSDEEDDHRLERKPDGGAYAEVATLPPNVTFYRDSGLVKGTKYWYKVRAKQGAAYSDYSNEDDATTISEPSAPTGFSISEIDADYMVLAWTKTSGETGYKIEKSLNGSDYTEICVIDAGLERFKVFGLTPSTHYWFKIRAYNAAGNSSYTAADDDYTLAQHADTALEKILRHPKPELVYLCEIYVKMQLSGFALTSGKTYTYEVAVEERGIDVSTVLENGAAYTEKSSVNEVEATASTFYFDYWGRKLYVHTSTGDDPVDFQILAEFWVYFTDYKTADHPAIYNDNNYLCLLRRDGIPDIAHEISRYYTGNYMVDSGRLSFINGKVGDEYYFDKRYALFIWENGKLVLKAGGLDFTYSQFETIYTGQVKDRSITDEGFFLDLRDLREGCERSLPLNIYTTEEYPNLDTKITQDVKIPFCFGTVSDFVPACIDTVNKKFKLHDGRIKSVTSVKKNGEITLVADTDYFIDYQNGTIMLARALGWETDADYLVVEFTGAVNSADETIQNGADVFKYACNNFLGLSDSELNLDWLYYTKINNTTTIAIPLYEETGSSDFIRQLEQSVRAYSFQDAEGRIGLRPKLTAALQSARYVRNHQIFSHSQTKRLEDDFYELTIHYDRNPQTGQYVFLRNYRNESTWKYRTAQPLEIFTYLTSLGDAQTLMNAIVEEMDKEIIEDTVSLLLLNVMPGDIIKYSRDRFFNVSGAASEVDLRILSITKSPASGKTRFTAEIV